MFTRELTHAGDVKRFTVKSTEQGWEIREERNSEVVRTARYTDWHRVERAMWMFERQDDASVPDLGAERHSTNR